MANIGVTPSTDPSAKPVATRPLTVNGVANVEVPYGIPGYESGGALVPVDATHGMPVAVVGAVEIANDAGNPIPVNGTVTANLGTLNGVAQDGADITTPFAMPAGGSGIRGWLSAIWTKLNGSLAVTGTFWQATQPVSGTVAVSNSGFAVSGNVEVTNDVGNPLPVSGTVAVSNAGFTANAGTNLNTSALALESGGNLAAIAAHTPALGQATKANSSPVTLPSDPDLRPASGNITAVDAASVSTSTGQNSATLVTGVPTANSSQSVALNGHGTTRVQVTGTWVGTLAIEISVDGGTTWTTNGGQVNSTAYIQGSLTGNCVLLVDTSGATHLRVRCTAYTSGTAVVQFAATTENGVVKIINALRLMDNTSGAQNTIKPASTAVASGDTAFAVGLHPSSPLPAGTNNVGVAIAPHQTGAVYSGTTALTPKFAAIAASSSGANTIVTAVAGKKIRVLKVTLSANGAVNAKFQSATTPTDLTGLFYLAANGGFGMGYCPLGHFETVAGEALSLNLSGAVAVGGVLTYCEV